MAVVELRHASIPAFHVSQSSKCAASSSLIHLSRVGTRNITSTLNNTLAPMLSHTVAWRELNGEDKDASRRRQWQLFGMSTHPNLM